MEVTPSADDADAVVALSQEATTSFGELSAVLNCNGDIFQAYKGDGTGSGAYAHDADIAVIGSEVYSITFDVDFENQTYSVSLNSATLGAKTLLAEDYPFRAAADTLAFVTGINPIDGQSMLIASLYRLGIMAISRNYQRSACIRMG